MCGIAGIISPSLAPLDLASSLQRMTDAIVHRGPDDQGHHVANGVAIGMRRLSIIDVAGGQQPIGNESGDIHVVSNGEIYNFQELRRQLISEGHQFRCQSDTEVVVHLYEKLGAECFRETSGMFGTAIWDERNNRLVLGRDRLGKKPLYYAQLGDRFLFGSEIKSLLAAAPELREPDYGRLAEYLQFGFIHEPNTFYRHIKKVPAAHFAVYQNRNLTIKPYWTLDFETDESKSQNEWAEELDQTLMDAVRIRLQSEVPLGVFLSGGIDSSAMVAYAHAAGLNPIKTFTIAFDRPEWDESADARHVANHFGTDHHELELSESELRGSMPSMLTELARHFDEPFADDSALPTYHVAKLARKHVTVILSGDGGDELFAGYSSYQGARFAQTYRQWIPTWLGRHVLPRTAEMAAGVLPDRLRYQALRVGKVLRESSLPMVDSYRDKASIWNRDSINELVRPEILAECELFGEQHLPDNLWAVLQSSSRDVVSRLTEIDIHSYMRDDILMKVDRTSMANSLEVRSPILDHRVVELAAAMPTRFKIRGSTGKAILRDLLSRRLPPKTVRKKKQGFAVPLREWFRHGLSDLVGDYLQYNGGRLPHDVFSKKHVDELLRQHRSGEADHGRRIWSLLSFAAWHDIYQADPTSISAENSPATAMQGGS